MRALRGGDRVGSVRARFKGGPLHNTTALLPASAREWQVYDDRGAVSFAHLDPRVTPSATTGHVGTYRRSQRARSDNVVQLEVPFVWVK